MIDWPLALLASLALMAIVALLWPNRRRIRRLRLWRVLDVELDDPVPQASDTAASPSPSVPLASGEVARPSRRQAG